METMVKLAAHIGKILKSQRLAVLSTYGSGYPYSSLVAFTVPDDLRHIIFATMRSTRKFAYLMAKGNVSLLIDTRKNRPADFTVAEAVTVLGTAHEAVSEEQGRLKALHLAKHPSLATFLASPACALFIVEVQNYYLVSHFQNVQHLQMR